jgi:phosphoglycolate phosphatase-like HAD superfamily hydrolase
MPAPQNVIAVVFDFDDTLTEDSTSQFLESRGVDLEAFWKQRVNAMVNDGWDAALAWMYAMLDETAPGKPLDGLTNADLRAFGQTLKPYPGLPGLFEDLRAIAAGFSESQPKVEFYIVSGGLEEIVLGSTIAGEFRAVRAGRFWENGDGVVSRIKTAINYTGKTRYLFEINKGLLTDKISKPFAVNEHVAHEDRRVPFENMIYVGDGLTDVPSFSLLKARGGMAFAVVDPTRLPKARKAWQKLVAPERVKAVCEPKYGETDLLGRMLRLAVEDICTRIELRGQMP